MTIKEKQFGQYDVKDLNYVKNCTEQDLYFNIHSLDEVILFLKHKMLDVGNEENEELIAKLQYEFEYCVMQTKRFGVEIEEPKEAEHVKATASYWAWYLWWNEYFQRTLTPEQWEEYQNKRKNGEDVTQYRPKGDWR